jgi:hypothetical protein
MVTWYVTDFRWRWWWIWIQREWNAEPEHEHEHEHEPISGLWKLFQSWTTGDDGSDDDDASQYGSNGGDDATHGRGQSFVLILKGMSLHITD